MNATAFMTLAEFAALPDVPGKSELLRGELIQLPPPKMGHGQVQRRNVAFLSSYLEKHSIGEVFTNVGFQMSDDTCLEPDVAFVRHAQLADTGPDDWFHGAPALAVEILSRSNTASEIEDKVRIYLDNGAEGVWVFNPKRKRLTAYYPDGHFETVELPHGEITAPKLFPGLRVPLTTVFDGLE
jgi:Uma2 family endonuclease